MMQHTMQLIIALEFGGAESLALNICRQLQRTGMFRVSLCGFFGTKGVLAGEAEQYGVGVSYLDAFKRSKLAAMCDLYCLLRRERVSVIQVHGAYLLQFAVLPALMAGTKIIYTEHAKHSILRYPRLRWVAKIFSNACLKVVCVSKDLRDFMASTVGVRPSRLQVIHNGIDIERFSCSINEEIGRRNRNQVIGTVARLTEAKDHENLLCAFAAVRKVEPDVCLLLVGDGELREEVESMISSLRLEDAVEMTGKRSDIPQLLNGMDIFVLPSRREGFPVSIIEAMACGRAVVATDVGGVREIIDDGVDGIIVPPEDHQSLAAALAQLLQDQELRNRLALNARKKVVKLFSEQTMMGKYMRLFISAGGHLAQ